MQKQKDSFVRDRTLVIRELQCAAEHESCAGQQEILERGSLPRAETAIHAIVTDIVTYNMGDDTVLLPRYNGMNCGSRNPAKRNIQGTACYPAVPKKLKYFLKDENLNC
jgi:mono-ADP-ribosyltransferase sirtuin 6